MEAQDRIFYARLSLASSLAFVVFGYITMLSIGLGLLFLAVVSAVLTVVFRPGRDRAPVSAMLVIAACIPPAWMAIAWPQPSRAWPPVATSSSGPANAASSARPVSACHPRC